ncbi:MAG TPA: CorA family divalent cation transporter [Gaiellaceae bacterium]|nr:CorA family divalent cation transporter [Gaiellaceae bacterium]
MAARWLDLVDPTKDEVLRALPPGVDPDVVEVLLAPASDGVRVRPLLESHGGYVFGIFLEAVPEQEQDRITYREIDVVASPELVVTVRKSPTGSTAWSAASTPAEESAGALLHRLIDDVAESFVSAVGAVDDEIDELEEHMEDWSPERVRGRVSGLRQDLLHARRNVSATRAAIRRIVDHRLDVSDDRLFPTEVEQLFVDTYETLVRAGDELDVARDLLASARDHHQAKVAESQNEIVKTLTVIASLVLVPTLIVGYYGQNFEGAFDDWQWSLAFSTSLIVVTTVVQLVVYRWRRWI